MNSSFRAPTKVHRQINRSINSLSDLDDREIEAACLKSVAKNIQWLIDRVSMNEDKLTIAGWALREEENAQNTYFLINDHMFEQVQYPISSPDLTPFFWNIPSASNARFACQTTITEDSFKDGFICLQFVENNNESELTRRKAWYLPNPYSSLPVPEAKRISRVIGVGDSASYLIGGASIFKRFEDYLWQKFSRRFSNFPNILDWGCGSGRVSRYFNLVQNSKTLGIDIDGDNINWCNKNLSSTQVKFEQIPLLPPTSYPDNYFDLIIGISVLTHLDEEKQFLWLQELKRIAKPGAILMLSIHGLAALGLYRTPVNIIRKVEDEGFVITGKNFDLEEVITEENYYLNVIQSRDYIHERWSKYFSIVEILDAMASNQDIVVMIND